MPPKPIAVVTSDTHGEPRAWVKHPGLEGDSYFALAQIADYCLGHHLPLILAGDVFDQRHPDPHTVNVFVRHLTRLREEGLGVCFIQGQHEYSQLTPWLSLVPGAWHVHEQWFFLPSGHDVPRVKFYGLDFTHAEDLPGALAGIPPDTDVLIAHQVWEEHMGKHAAPEGRLRDVPHVKLVITGDFHGHKVTNLVARDGRKLRVASPGSTCLQEVGEDPDKYFFVLYDDLSLRSVPLKGRPLSRHHVYTEVQLNRLVDVELPAFRPPDDLPPHVAVPVAHVRYLDTLPEAADRIQAAARERCHLFLVPVSATKEAEAEAPPGEDEPRGLEWHLCRGREEDRARYETALRFWKSHDLKAEIDAFVREAMKKSEDADGRGIWSSATTQEEDSNDREGIA